MRIRQIAKAAVVLAAVVLACVLAGAASSGKNESEESVPRLETRCYDVSDLLDQDVGHSAAPMFTVLGSAMGSEKLIPQFDGCFETKETGDLGIEELVDRIKRHVNHESNAAVAAWSDEGGPATIDWVANLLLVSQTQEAHKQIEDSLALVRKNLSSSVNVGIRAVWIQVDQALARQFLNSKPAPQTVDLEALRKAGAQVLCSAQVTTCNLRRVWLSANRTDFVVGDTAKSGKDSKVLKPDLGPVSGAILVVTPIIQKGGKAVRIGLFSQFVGLGEGAKSLVPIGADSKNQPPIDISQRSALLHEFKSSVELPVGKPTIVGGMSLSPGEPDGKVIYLVLTVDLSQ
jgi:hypothetical protein